MKILILIILLTSNLSYAQIMIPNLIADAGEFILQEKGNNIQAINIKGPSFNEWYGYYPQDFGYKYMFLVRYKNVQVPYYSFVWEFDHSKDNGDGIASVSMCVTAFSANLIPYVYSGTKCTEEKIFKLKFSDGNEKQNSTGNGG
jgi:hypothetical protein